MTNSNIEEEILTHFNILYGDVQFSITKLNNSSDEDFEFYARAYIRAYASWIEGSIWIYKEVIRKAEYQWHKSLPLASQLFIFEYDWQLDNSGQPIIRQKKIRTQDNLKGFFFVMRGIFKDFPLI